jgi:hypothetical protein
MPYIWVLSHTFRSRSADTSRCTTMSRKTLDRIQQLTERTSGRMRQFKERTVDRIVFVEFCRKLSKSVRKLPELKIKCKQGIKCIPELPELLNGFFKNVFCLNFCPEGHLGSSFTMESWYVHTIMSS